MFKPRRNTQIFTVLFTAEWIGQWTQDHKVWGSFLGLSCMKHAELRGFLGLLVEL